MTDDGAGNLERADYDLVAALPGPVDDLEERIRAAGLTAERLITDWVAVEGAGPAERIEMVPFEQPAGWGADPGRLTAGDLAALSAARHGLFVTASLGDDARADAEAVVRLIAAIVPEAIAIEDAGTWTWRSGRWARAIGNGRPLPHEELFDFHSGETSAGMRMHTHGLARVIGMELALVADTDDEDLLDEARELLVHAALVAAVGHLPAEGEPFAVAEDLAVRWTREPEPGPDDDDEDDDDHGHDHPTGLIDTVTDVPPVGYDAALIDGWYIPQIVDDLNGRQARETLPAARAAAAEADAQVLLYLREAGVVDDDPDLDEAAVMDWQLVLPSDNRLGPFSAHDLGVLADLEAGEEGVTRIWSGLCEVIEIGDSAALEGGDGAFVTAVAQANSQSEFARTATVALVERGLLAVEVADIESFAVDYAATIETDQADYDALMHSVALDGGVEFGPLHIWSEDGDD
jgi:hypothetical protein